MPHLPPSKRWKLARTAVEDELPSNWPRDLKIPPGSEHGKRVTVATAYAIWRVCADRALKNEHFEAFVSAEALADDLGITRTVAQRCVSYLLEIGKLEYTGRRTSRSGARICRVCLWTPLRSPHGGSLNLVNSSSGVPRKISGVPRDLSGVPSGDRKAFKAFSGGAGAPAQAQAPPEKQNGAVPPEYFEDMKRQLGVPPKSQ